MKNSTQLYKELTNNVIALLEQQQLTWDKPWMSLDDFGGLARNASSGRMYSMVNQIILSLELKNKQYAKNAWLTFKQIKELGGTIKKGEKSVPIYFNTYTWKDKFDRKYTWEEIKNLSMDEKKTLEIKSSYYLTSYLVFNVFQTKDLPDIYYQLPSAHFTISFEVEEIVERILDHHESSFNYFLEKVNEAYYDVQKDVVVLPTKEQFTSPEAFYSTLFHEFIHWTGHESRLNRVTLMGTTQENYADEEIIAELGAMFICAQLGLTKDISQNAAYIQHWLSALKKDNRYIMKMVSFSERACKYILGDFKIEEMIFDTTLEDIPKKSK